ncbi:major facilitator superfamily domain-containing protein [Naematelia encephala]|uniref:Major facilitator superfamily domain-containing protein n=1 Tax=Naematelia encephala TaxID=71784 RepID=A0A1Y2BLP1_9TREE|nr:major facilitator superfamily domain-containing protein [Naematelia encephala]
MSHLPNQSSTSVPAPELSRNDTLYSTHSNEETSRTRTVSPTATAVELHLTTSQRYLKAEEAATAPLAEAARERDGPGGAEIKLSQGRKWFLLFIFSVAQYLDIASYSGLFVFTDAILNDLGILYESSSWIITAYSVTFASFLLFWGRVSDLYSAKPVFAWGFLGLGIINLIISFMPNQYAYFVFRAISGIFGAATIPSAFRLILAIFEPEELQVALTIFGLSGALANVTGLLIGGFFGFITAGGQMAGWRWFFRFITIVIVPFSFAAFTMVPKTKGDKAEEVVDRADKFKRLDIVGCFSMLVSIILLILGLTLGASYGFKTAKFLVPFLLSWPIFVFFFVWESKLPEGYALIPPAFWRIPNMTILIFFALGIYPWWAVNQLPLVERVIAVFHEKPIIAALRMLPQGIAALFTAMIIPPLLQKLRSARAPIALGTILGAAAYLLMIYDRNGEIHNHEYWRWYFPAFVFGSAGTMCAFLGVNITVMTSVPPSASGVAGALLQVALQMGAVIGLSVQAGMLTLNPGAFSNYANVQASFWFQFGWCLFNVILFLIFFRPGKVAPGSEAAKAAAAVQTDEKADGVTA